MHIKQQGRNLKARCSALAQCLTSLNVGQLILGYILFLKTNPQVAGVKDDHDSIFLRTPQRPAITEAHVV